MLGEARAQLRGGGGELEGRGIGRVHPADHGCHEALEHRGAEPGAHHLGDGRPGTGSDGRGQEALEARAQGAAQAQHRPDVGRQGPPRDAEQRAARRPVHPGSGDHAAAQALARADDLLGQAQLGDQGIHGTGADRVRLGACVQDELRGRIRAGAAVVRVTRDPDVGDRAAHRIAGLQEHHPVPRALVAAGCEQARESAADDEGALAHAWCVPCR